MSPDLGPIVLRTVALYHKRVEVHFERMDIDTDRLRYFHSDRWFCNFDAPQSRTEG